MKITSAEFVLGAARPNQFPNDGKPEIVFAGRSNVGKSSLINRLLGRKNLARTSNQPGKTQQINFYLINDSFRLVDLPGYGYAKVSRKEKGKWQALIESYLRSDRNIKAIFHLIDARHPAMTSDEQLAEFLRLIGASSRIILTKADKLSKNEFSKALPYAKRIYSDDILPFSSKTGMGKDEIAGLIESLVA